MTILAKLLYFSNKNILNFVILVITISLYIGFIKKKADVIYLFIFNGEITSAFI